MQVWNIDVQKTLPWGVVLNVGYNGSKGNNLDITIAPRATASSPRTDPGNLLFNYEQAAAFSQVQRGDAAGEQAAVSSGIALGANYQYSHSIDNAGSVGGTSTVVAQNWQNLRAEEGNSSFDQRHKVSGTYLYELPFGKDKHWLTSGAARAYSRGIFGLRQLYVCHRHAADAGLSGGGVRRGARHGGHAAAESRRGRVADRGRRLAEEVVQHRGVSRSPRPTRFGNAFGNASRNSIAGPGTVQNNMSLSKTHAAGRHAQHGIARHGQQRLQHGAVLPAWIRTWLRRRSGR